MPIKQQVNPVNRRHVAEWIGFRRAGGSLPGGLGRGRLLVSRREDFDTRMGYGMLIPPYCFVSTSASGRWRSSDSYQADLMLWFR